jgi:hypothetical protein
MLQLTFCALSVLNPIENDFRDLLLVLVEKHRNTVDLEKSWNPRRK